MYIASRGLLKRKVPTVIVPKCVKTAVENLFAVQRKLDDSELPVNLIGMDVSSRVFESQRFIDLVLCQRSQVVSVSKDPALD